MVLPAAAMAWLALQSSYTRERAAMERTLRETTRALALVVDRELTLRESLAWTLRGSPSLLAGDYAAFHAQASLATTGLGGWVVLADPATHRQLVNTHRPWGTPLPAGISTGLAEGLDESSVRVSDVMRGPVAGSQIVAVSVLAPRERGSPLLLSVVLPPAQLQRVIEEQGLPREWTAAVLDRGGHIVARQPNPERWVGTPATQDVRERIAARAEGLFRSRTLDGASVTTYFSRSPAHDWTFIIGVPDAVAGAAARESIALVALAAALLVGLAALLAIVSSRRIAASIGRVHTAARALEEGGEVRYAPSDVDELDEIGRTLTSASRRIGEANATLTRRVAAAVAETEQAQERMAAGQRLEALGRLTGGVAHDVNNLLSVVTNNLFVLRRMLSDARGAEQVAAIQRAVESGRQLTQKLLAFSRRRTMSPQPIEVASWLPAAASMIRSSVSRAVDVRVYADPDTPAIDADPTELELALVNLAVNANDAMPDGGTLTVRARRARPEECADGVPSACIEVEDTGEGIDPAIVEKVFEPFFTTKDASKGSGLGLSQVYGFCAQSGGSVQLDSRPGAGTRVVMRLPQRHDGRGAVPVPAAAPAPQPGASRAGCVLYVEDNDDVAAATRAVLETFGYGVDRVADAAAALARLHAQHYDAVLSDVVMPGPIDGLELARIVRAQRPTLPVVLMTGYSEESAAAVAAGFEVLEKPCVPETLAAALDRRMAGARAPQPGPMSL